MFKRNTVPASVWRNPIHFLGFGLGTGAAPYAPGTCGTLPGVALVWLLSLNVFYPLVSYLLVTVALFILGVRVCDVISRDIGMHDHSGIVIDEVAGYMVAMIAMPVNVWTVTAGFVLFRFFDIFKPWPIQWLDKHVKGGFGMMIDDVLAGLFTVVILQTGWYVFF